MLPQPPSDFALIAGWRTHLEALGLAKETIRAYTAGVHKLMTEQVQGAVGSTTEEHIDAFLASFARRSTTRAQAALGVRSFLSWCHRRGFLAVDPTTEVRVSKPRARAAVVLEEDELIRYMIAAAWRSPRRAWAIMLSFSIGCRRAELAGIAPRDLLGKKVRLRKAKGGRIREVELNELARTAIEELRPWWTENSILGGVVPQTITEWCHDAAVDSGLLDKVTQRPTHVLRASFATHLLRQGVPIMVVRDLMGHLDIATTGIYAVAAAPDRELAVRRLPFASGVDPAAAVG